jgi:hypothetical protein
LVPVFTTVITPSLPKFALASVGTGRELDCNGQLPQTPDIAQTTLTFGVAAVAAKIGIPYSNKFAYTRPVRVARLTIAALLASITGADVIGTLKGLVLANGLAAAAALAAAVPAIPGPTPSVPVSPIARLAANKTRRNTRPREPVM